MNAPSLRRVIWVTTALLFLLSGLPSISLASPRIHGLRIITSDPIPRYGLFEIAFDLDTVATNPYWPYDAAPPQGVPVGTGVSVDMLVLPPGQADWGQALTVPCFWYQPMVEMGQGDDVTLLPKGQAEWRARYAPTEIGRYTYRLHAVDASGTTWGDNLTFDAELSDSAGYVRVGQQDVRFFEADDGTPLLSPLVNMEQGQPFYTLASIRDIIPRLAENGIHFVRWFPTGEGSNYSVAPFGDNIRIAWQFGDDAGITSLQNDAERERLFSFEPYYYSSQSVPAVPGDRYRVTLWAAVDGDRVLRVGLGPEGIDLGSASGQYHESLGKTCDYRQDGWHSYTLSTVAESETISVDLRGLYVGENAPAPYDIERDGAIRVHSVALQRDEDGQGSWGPNLLSRGDPDTHTYVDQRSAALLDEILSVSVGHGVYHKLPLFHKNDHVLNSFASDGGASEDWDETNVRFYSSDGGASRWYQQAYVRYFVGRWSYSTAIHSLELANENHLTSESYQAGWDMAAYVKNISPRYLMVSNSFWGYFASSFFQDSTYGYLLDYADQHWHASEETTNPAVVSNMWDDSAAYVREAWTSFGQMGYGSGPIVRGECGVAETSTFPQHPDIAREIEGVYYHKKVWAHVGSLGWTMDGDWYPRLTSDLDPSGFPNAERSVFDVYAAYARFVADEPLNNGQYVSIGTDLLGEERVDTTMSLGSLRAYGVRDANAGRALLWIDNPEHTWARVYGGESVGPASGNVILARLPEGRYQVTWWDTTAGAATSSESHDVEMDGTLSLAVSGLVSDVAVKVVRIAGPVTTPFKQPIALDAGWNLISFKGAPQESEMAYLLSPVASWCDAVWGYDATDAANPWRRYSPDVPPYANSLETVDETMGLWVHMRSPVTLLVLGSTGDTDIPLASGWNLVGYPRLVAMDISQATASIAAYLGAVYAWDSTASAWDCWDPTDSACALAEFEPGRGYWIYADAPCLWDIP